MLQMHLVQGDITKIEADAIVNAANTSLLGGGGVDGAIHRAGGSAILDACQAIRARQGGCKVGEAVITTAGKLAAQYVIHTVGPRWNNGKSQEAERLRSCYNAVLALAEVYQLRTIAFPNISTGIYGFPKVLAAPIAIDAVQDAQFQFLETVYWVCFDQENYDLYQQLLKE